MAEQDFAAIGRIVAERKEIKDSIEVLKKFLNHQGRTLVQLGNALSDTPEGVVFEGQSTTLRHMRSAIYKVEDELIPSLKSAVNSLREKLDELIEIERKAQPFGV